MDLGARLGAAFEFVRRGSVVYDIGSDHGYLPAALILKGVCPRAVVSDINRGPLQRAVRTFEENGISDKAEFYLTGGLSGIEFSEKIACDVCICGMGGELIASILREGNIPKNADVRFILQPMSRPWELRRFLWDEGYEIFCEKTVSEGDKIYSIMSVCRSGRKTAYTNAELYIGKREARSGSETEAYIEKIRLSLEKKRDGKRAGGADTSFEDEIISCILSETGRS